MSKLIDQVRERFKRNLRPIEVPEWGATLYFGPLTVADVEAAEARNPKGDYEKNLYLLVSAARDAEGKPAFALEDVHILRREASANTIAKLVSFMWQEVPTPEAARAELKDPNAQPASA